MPRQRACRGEWVVLEAIQLDEAVRSRLRVEHRYHDVATAIRAVPEERRALRGVRRVARRHGRSHVNGGGVVRAVREFIELSLEALRDAGDRAAAAGEADGAEEGAPRVDRAALDAAPHRVGEAA